MVYARSGHRRHIQRRSGGLACAGAVEPAVSDLRAGIWRIEHRRWHVHVAPGALGLPNHAVFPLRGPAVWPSCAEDPCSRSIPVLRALLAEVATGRGAYRSVAPWPGAPGMRTRLGKLFVRVVEGSCGATLSTPSTSGSGTSFGHNSGKSRFRPPTLTSTEPANCCPTLAAYGLTPASVTRNAATFPGGSIDSLEPAANESSRSCPAGSTFHFLRRRRTIARVGARGFEPPTSSSRTMRATRLRYAPRETRV